MVLEQIKQAIEALKPLAGPGQLGPELLFVLGGRQDLGAWDAIKTLGGAPKSTLYEYPDRKPCVIESMAVVIEGVEVRIQRDRPPTAKDMARKHGTYRNINEFTASAV